ncbi:MAG TPA: DUF4394 domain-containing protein [Gemmataceae bacterium]|jgi:hypothetical protein
MTRSRLRLLAALTLLTATVPAPAGILTATSTANNSPYPSFLVTFDTSNPGTLLSSVVVTGADVGTPATGNPNGQQFIISGIDYRPSTGQLYGLGWRSGFEQRVYTIDAAGTATGVGNPFYPASSAGFNFDPVRDTIRLTSDQGGNQRFNPTTGIISSDNSLAYAAGDPNAGVTPKVSSVSYANHVPGAAATTLYGIDARGTGTLVVVGTPGSATSADGGQLHTVGPLNLSFAIPINSPVAFEIDPFTGSAYAAIEPAAGAPSHLFSVDLATGTATDLGQIGPNGTLPIWGLTVVPEPGTLALAGAGLAGAVGWSRRRRTARRS